jgi:putative tricarboxylic transport membrane protein
MSKADRVVGLALLLLSLACAAEGWRTWDGVGGTGFFPSILAGIFAALGFGLLRGKSDPEEDIPISWPDKTSRRELALVFFALVVYAIATQWIGYPAATTLFLAGLCKIIGNKRWPFSFLFGAGVSAVTYVVFKMWLNMPLPVGLAGI